MTSPSKAMPQAPASAISIVRCDLDAPFLAAYRKTCDDWQFEYVVQPTQEADFIRAIAKYNNNLEDLFSPHFPIGIICLFPPIGATSCQFHLRELDHPHA